VVSDARYISMPYTVTHAHNHRKKKSEESDVRKRVLLFPRHNKILFLFVRQISERGVRRKRT
jgi:hypothetical protein